MGKRQIGDMQPFELVVTLIIADLACIPMADVSIPIVFGIVPLITLVIFHYIFTLLNRHCIWFRKLVNGKPIIIIDKNGINYNALKKLNMTLNDLTEGLRANQCFNIGDVAFAIVETNGSINIMLKSTASPPTANDMKIKKAQDALSIIIVNDGKLMEENLEVLKLSHKKIENFLKKEKIESIQNLIVLMINANGDVFYQEKNKSSKSSNIEVNV